jgi:long-subunit fatty acid transport protein
MVAMMQGCRIKGMALAAGLLCPLVSVESQATLSEGLTIGNARALALGNAVTADPPGIDSIHFNPAGLARLEGRQSHLKVVGATFDIILEFGDYNDERKQYLAQQQASGLFSNDYFIDEAHNSSSETSGIALMLPFFGMTDMPFALAPLGGASYKPPGSNVTFGTNVYAPMMVGFFREADDPGRWMGERLSFMQLTYFSPSVAYEITDELTVGVAMTFNYAGVGIDLPFRQPHAGLPFLGWLQGELCPDFGPGLSTGVEFNAICGDRIGLYDLLGYLSFEVEQPLTVGFNVGFLWQPTPWLTLGMMYQPSIPMDMKGEYAWRNGDSWNNFITELVSDPAYQTGTVLAQLFGYRLPSGEAGSKGAAYIDMDTPEFFSTGVSVQVTSRLKVNLDYKYAGWAAWETIPVRFENSIDLLGIAEIVQPDAATHNSVTFPLGLSDTWNWGVGVEYQWNNAMVLRFGIEDRPSSAEDGARTPLIPMGSGKLYGAGFGYKLPGGGVMDFALGYFASSMKMPGGTSKLGNSTDPVLMIYNPYAGTDIDAELSVYLVEFSISQQF